MLYNFHAMIIGAHPDDSEFAIAGTVARWTAEGKKVIYVICTNGNKGTDDPKITPQRLMLIREKEERAAARLLGVKDVIFLGHDDQSLEDTPEFRKELVTVIRTYKPEIVAAPDPYRRYIWHRDHRITGQAVLDAIFPLARDRLAYPDLFKAGLGPHKVKELLFWGADEPNYFNDIENTYQIKLSALRCHKSQLSQFNEAWEKWLRRMHTSHANMHDFKLAEAFHRVQIKY
ncbi:MAG: PIG-L family deacetylase [Dehalococcoidia bacterium]|nr:PIG-L family deacetylase [Dehalococcoidia bacterium]